MESERTKFEEILSGLSAAGNPWEAGITSLSLLLPLEQKRHLGFTPPEGETTIEEANQRWRFREVSQKDETLDLADVPSAFDLRNVAGRNFVTPIRDQRDCRSSVSFGTVATVESQIRVHLNNPDFAVDLSEAHMFFCHGYDRGATCEKGWTPDQAFDAFKSKGVTDEFCYPYDIGLAERDCRGLCSNWSASAVMITGYTNLTGDIASIKRWISTTGPVCACLIVYEDLFSYKSGIYKNLVGNYVGGHCMAIVGYNDDPGYWICKNSWGTDWGEQGFFRIAYNQCAIDSWQNYGVNGIANIG
jgi:C1A family cysteine protease